MEQTHQALMHNDFFAKKKNDNSWEDVQSKEQKITQSEIELKKTKDLIAKHIQEQHRLEKEIKEQ